MTDIHCHILYGVDDGAACLAESIAMLHAAKSVGITTIIATPHVRTSGYDITKAASRLAELRPYAQQLNINILQGFEYDYRVLADETAADARKFCIQGTDFLLLELDSHLLALYWERLVYDLQHEGIKIIIAHAERYAAIQRDLEIAERMVDMGCKLQIDGCSLLHKFGKNRECTRELLKRGLVSFLASDAHCALDYQLFAKVYKKISQPEYCENICDSNIC